MKRAALGVASALTLVALGAQAADMAPPPVFSWTGLYLGIEGGGGWGREDYSDNSTIGFPPGVPISQSPSGGIFGGVLGYRYQTGRFVFGIEGTATGADLTSTFAPSSTETDSFKVRSLYTATGQAGLAFNQAALLYVKGGWAGGSVDTSTTVPATGGFASQRQTDNGWTLGVGFDYAILQNLALGFEYNHFDLDYSAFNTVGVLGHTYVVGDPGRLTIDQAVGRLTYKFDIH